jgi:hypothetical protein
MRPAQVKLQKIDDWHEMEQETAKACQRQKSSAITQTSLRWITSRDLSV